MASIAPVRIATSESSTRPLLWRVAATNVLIFSIGVAALATSPATVSFPISRQEALVLVVGTAVMALGNVLALRRAFTPLARLSQQMEKVDPLEPGIRALDARGAREVVALTNSFNRMAERLELERRDSASRALRAQEAERRRIAQELHDDIGQSLTFLLIQLSRARNPDEGGLQALDEAHETARAILEDARGISERLRPESLDDLGLVIALEALASRVGSAAGIEVTTHLARELPALDADTEVAIFRIAQEALTNVLRHARATCASVSLEADGDRLLLCVRDDGNGAGSAIRARGAFRAMRERALSVGGSLDVTEVTSGGTCVTLAVRPVKA